MKKNESNIPRVLYKYRNLHASHALKILTHGELYFATSAELEDQNEKASFSFNHASWVNENNSLILLSPEERKDRLTKVIRSGKDEPYGIMSLCATKQELFMWENYSNNFNGVCIGLHWSKIDLPFYAAYSRKKNSPIPVIYQKEIKIDSNYITPEKSLEIYHSKLESFSCEKEYRWFYKAGAYANPLIRHAIKEIIFGDQVPLEEILKIKKIIADIPGVNFLIAKKIGNTVQIENLNLDLICENLG